MSLILKYFFNIRCNSEFTFVLLVYFALESGKEYEMKLKVYYEDVLQNWYCQIVDIDYNATTITNGSYPLGTVEYKVNEEILLDDKEVPKEL